MSLDAGTLRQIAGPRPGEGAVRVFQGVSVHVARLDGDQRVECRLAAGRAAWVQVARGAVTLDGTPLHEGDGAAVTEQDRIAIAGAAPAEVIVFGLDARTV